VIHCRLQRVHFMSTKSDLPMGRPSSNMVEVKGSRRTCGGLWGAEVGPGFDLGQGQQQHGGAEGRYQGTCGSRCVTR
jgi:hypothetical protein